MSILGNRVVRREDPRFLTSGGVYGEDLPFDRALWVTFVRSTVAHARIASIDAEDAKRIPGVVGIYSGGDIDLPLLQSGLPGVPPEMGRPLLAVDTVRFVGEPVAVILTEDRSVGEDASEAVFVDYEPLDPVVDPEESLAPRRFCLLGWRAMLPLRSRLSRLLISSTTATWSWPSGF